MFSYKILKRLMDIFAGLIGIIIFFPILIAAAIWIKIVSPEGSILADIPHRVGKNKKPFRFLKLRSMVPNAHELMLNDPVLYKKYVENSYKLEPHEDPRLIKGAVFLRKYSIDEMPQFINILMGDMSIVGPRAYNFLELEEQAKRHPEAKKYIEKALSVKPGLTGVWQVSGRSEIGFLDRVKMDSEYAENTSILYDLLIVLKTPYVILTGKGAY